MQAIAHAEHLKVIERRKVDFPRDGVPSKHHHHWPDEEENQRENVGKEDTLPGLSFEISHSEYLPFF